VFEFSPIYDHSLVPWMSEETRLEQAFDWLLRLLYVCVPLSVEFLETVFFFPSQR
jgi:hypothetical protein